MELFLFVLVLHRCTAKVLHDHSLRRAIQEASSDMKKKSRVVQGLPSSMYGFLIRKIA